jgi:hypothetical protein
LVNLSHPGRLVRFVEKPVIDLADVERTPLELDVEAFVVGVVALKAME